MIGKSPFYLAIFVGSLLGLSAGAVTTSKNVDIVVTHGPVALTTSTYVNTTGSIVPSGTPLLMAQPFRRGDVFAAGNCATPHNAATHNPLIWQHDNTATRRENGDDGSVRHWTFGVLTDAPVPAGGFYTIEWVTTGAACPTQTAHQTLATLAAAHDLKVHFTNVTNQDLTMRGSGNLTFDINAAASNTGRDAPSKYAQGPVYDGFRIAGPPTWDAASSGRLIGAQLSPTQISQSNWTGITNGAFHVVVDGAGHDVTGIDLSSTKSLTDVATAINARLTAAGAGATMSWQPTDEISHFELFSKSTGTSSTVSLLTAAASGTDISSQLLMTAGATAYNSTINAYTAPGVAAGSQDPLLYAICDVDVTTQSNGTTMGKVRTVCTLHNAWLSVAAGTTGRAGNPGPAGYPHDPQAINYRAALLDGTHTLIDFSAMRDATIDTSITPILINATGGKNCSKDANIPSCWVIPQSSGQTPWFLGGAHVFTTTGTPPHCYYGAGLYGAVSTEPCQYSIGHLYFDYPAGTAGSQGLDSTHVSFMDIEGNAQVGYLNPTDQGTGIVTWSSRIAHTKYMFWSTVAPDTSEPWSDGTSVSYSPFQPAFDQGPFSNERRYWEETGTIVPISLAQTPNVNYDVRAGGSYFYQPMGRGPVVGGGGQGFRPDIAIINEYAAACWVTMNVSGDCEHARSFALGQGIYPVSAVLHEATGRVPALNNGPPVFPGGGQGGSYGLLGAALNDGVHDVVLGTASDFGVAALLSGAPINLTWGDQGQHFYREAHYGASFWDTGACCAMDHEPEFQGLDYLVWGAEYMLDNIYLHADRGLEKDFQQHLSGTPNTYYAHMIGEAQVRGGSWIQREVEMCAAFGDDTRDERTYCNDVLHENYYAQLAWAAWIDGSTPGAWEASLTIPADVYFGDTFVQNYGTWADYKGQVMLHDPLSIAMNNKNAKIYQAACGHSVADWPAYPPAYYCTTYIPQRSIHNGGIYTGGSYLTALPNIGAVYNTTDGSDYGSAELGFGFTAGSGQVVTTYNPPGPNTQIVAGDLIRNYAAGYSGNPADNIDQLDPTRQYTVIPPIDNNALTFHIRCEAADHVAFPAQCPVAGQAFTGFTVGGTPLTGTNYWMLLHSQYDNGYTYNGTYISMVASAIEALQAAGYDMSAALGQLSARFGIIKNASAPSNQFDPTVSVP
jgi:hypothetical protein